MKAESANKTDRIGRAHVLRPVDTQKEKSEPWSSALKPQRWDTLRMQTFSYTGTLVTSKHGPATILGHFQTDQHSFPMGESRCDSQ